MPLDQLPHRLATSLQTMSAATLVSLVADDAAPRSHALMLCGLTFLTPHDALLVTDRVSSGRRTMTASQHSEFWCALTSAMFPAAPFYPVRDDSCSGASRNETLSVRSATWRDIFQLLAAAIECPCNGISSYRQLPELVPVRLDADRQHKTLLAKLVRSNTVLSLSLSSVLYNGVLLCEHVHVSARAPAHGSALKQTNARFKTLHRTLASLRLKSQQHAALTLLSTPVSAKLVLSRTHLVIESSEDTRTLALCDLEVRLAPLACAIVLQHMETN